MIYEDKFGLKIKQIVNQPVSSNCFVIYNSVGSNCVIIDPGSKSLSDIAEFIVHNKLKPSYIILTHGHFDHIWSVDYLRSKFRCKLICSQTCSDSIQSNKKNLSLFYDEIGFEINRADILIEDINYQLIWYNCKFSFFDTPGHSECSICIKINDIIFTGDTIIKNLKTITKIPGGSKSSLKESLLKIENIISIDTVFFGGHNEIFNYKEYISFKLKLKS